MMVEVREHNAEIIKKMSAKRFNVVTINKNSNSNVQCGVIGVRKRRWCTCDYYS